MCSLVKGHYFSIPGEDLMYQALYRKWRPQSFDDVIGQRHITETLKNQVKTGRLSHAYLFIGTRGTGKTTCARILAKAVNCENPVDGNPCGVCRACRGISEGSVLDVVELDAASNNGVDNVRALREEAVFSPATVKKRVYIIDEVHMLSLSAFNALLKILEEPPEHLMFILATTELHKVPATILSRCQRHSFKRIDAAAITDYLEYIAAQEHFDLTREAAELIARLADGGVRDALSLLDQCSASEKIDLDAVYGAMGLAGNLRTAAVLKKIIEHRTEDVLREFNSMWMDGKDPAVFLTELTNLLRDTLMMKVAPRGGLNLISGAYDNKTLSDLAGNMTQEEIFSAMKTLQDAQAQIRGSANPKTSAELCLVSLCDGAADDCVSSLRARISRLEEQVKNGGPLPTHPVLQKADPPQAEKQTSGEKTTHVALSQECEEPKETSAPARAEPLKAEPQPKTEEKKPAPEVPCGTAAGSETKPALSWEAICHEARPLLPKAVGTRLDDTTALRGRLEDGMLFIEAEPGFIYAQLNRREVLAAFSETAGRLAGREVRVILKKYENKPGEEKPTENNRNLNDLKAFPEVRFIN